MKKYLSKQDEWPDGLPVVGEEYLTIKPSGGSSKQVYTGEPDKSITERQWRDSELLRTDKLIILPDYPVDLLPYRMKLRDYPDKFDFPNGDRPAM